SGAEPVDGNHAVCLQCTPGGVAGWQVCGGGQPGSGAKTSKLKSNQLTGARMRQDLEHLRLPPISQATPYAAISTKACIKRSISSAELNSPGLTRTVPSG